MIIISKYKTKKYTHKHISEEVKHIHDSDADDGQRSPLRVNSEESPARETSPYPARAMNATSPPRGLSTLSDDVKHTTSAPGSVLLESFEEL